MPKWCWVLILYLLCPIFREDFLAIYSSGMQLRTEFLGNAMVLGTRREGERIYGVM